MKRLLSWLTAVSAVIVLEGCGNASPSVSEEIDMQNIKGGVYYLGLVWQDTLDNTKVSADLEGAVKYCRQLRLFGSDKWRLPSGKEAYWLRGQDRDFFSHIAYDTYYHTGSVDETLCKNAGNAVEKSTFQKAYEAPFNVLTSVLESARKELRSNDARTRSELLRSPKTSCRYKLSDYYNIWYKRMPIDRPSLVRCVLDEKDYKEAYAKLQRAIAAWRKQGTYDGYLNAFRYSRNIDDIEKAFALAENDVQRRNAEEVMVETIPEKIFDITMKDLSGKEVDIHTSGTSGMIVDTTSRKHIRSQVTVKSTFLKYGSYDVYVKLKLRTVYRITSRVAIVSASHLSEYVSYKTVTFRLSAQNGYKETKEIDFGKIVAHSMTNAGIAGGSYELVDVKVRAEIAGAKPLR